MKKFWRISLIILGALALIAVIWIALILYLFTRTEPYVSVPVYSGDGSRVIIPTINYDKTDAGTYLCVHIEIRDAQSGKSIYQVQTHASDRMRWSVSWIDNATIRLDSSDIGTYCWQDQNGAWGEIKCP
jgi:hypothetical protein